MKEPIISGIQQIGIGVSNVHEAFAWYRKHLGMDIPMFDEAAEAGLMLPYTGGEPRSRHAILALNLQSGGGMEIWQYTSRTPVGPKVAPLLGDLGIFITKIKSKDVQATFEYLVGKSVNLLQDKISKTPEGLPHFYFKDPYDNIFEIVPANDWFSKTAFTTGGIYGCTIGVSDIEKSLTLYRDVLGYDITAFDESATFTDWSGVPGCERKCRRVLLRHDAPRKGAFSRMLGRSEIELVQALDTPVKKVFADRMWGDLGYIHLCFDISDMPALEALCIKHGFPFTVDSRSDEKSKDSFDMGEAAGHFTYIEDPDGTLIEFVEAHKIPILKKIGWYLDLKKRDRSKALPNWMLKTLGFGRIKD